MSAPPIHSGLPISNRNTRVGRPALSGGRLASALFSKTKPVE
jgi:hypothetical protein